MLQGEHAPSEHVEQRKSEVKRKLRERSVPSSSFGRAFGFAQLGVGLVYGSATDYVSSVRLLLPTFSSCLFVSTCFACFIDRHVCGAACFWRVFQIYFLLATGLAVSRSLLACL